MRFILSPALVLFMVLALVGCAAQAPPTASRWDAYYAHAAAPRTRVVVVPPEGASVPMAKLIARYVVQYLNKHDLSAEVGNAAQVATAKDVRTFVLSGTVEENVSDPRIRYRRVLHWIVSDVHGRLISTYAQGIGGASREWDFGSPRLLNAIGFDAADPIAQIVKVETWEAAPAISLTASLRRTVVLEGISGVSQKDSRFLMAALKKALRALDVQVTGDERQATLRVLGAVKMRPVPANVQPGSAPGRVDVRIVWTVATLDRTVVGRAVQENTVLTRDLKNGWAALAARVGAAAAVGIERIFAVRPRALPEQQDSVDGGPPEVVLPGVPGRAPPPPR